MIENWSAEDFRAHVRHVLGDELPQGWRGYGALMPEQRIEFSRTWRKTMLEHGFLAVTWPSEYGGLGLGGTAHAILAEELVRAGLPTTPLPNDPFGLAMLGPTLLHWGSEEQKQRFLPATLSGEISWAQGFSEPEAGSDLFGLRTSARVMGDNLVINGQKVWQTAGLGANWLFVLVRTDPDAARSKGISFVLVDVDQPGVEVRGIRNLTGDVEFAEVYFTDVLAPIDNVVGGLNNGAKVALTLLGFERGLGGLAAARGFGIELFRLIDLARSRGSWDDPTIRLRLGRCASEVQLILGLARQAMDDVENGRSLRTQTSSMIKLLTAEHRQTTSTLALEILGLDGLVLEGPHAAEWGRPQPLGTTATSSGPWVEDYLNARAGTIYGGSTEIQLNTIAEQVLGLPREAR